jgi:hypothetical protein
MLSRTFALALGLTVLLGGGVLAADTSVQSVLSQVDALEKLVFGSTRPSLALETRLRALEINKFGNYHTGSLATRLYLLREAANSNAAEHPNPKAANAKPASAAPPSDMRIPRLDGEVADKVKSGNVGTLPPMRVVLMPPAQKHGGSTDKAKPEAVKPPVGKPSETASASPQPAPAPPLKSADSAPPVAPPVAPAAQKLADQATIEFQNGNFANAINLLEQVAKVDPENAKVRFALCQSYRAVGDYEHARTALFRALSIDPSNRVYHEAMQTLMSENPDNDNGTTFGGIPGGGNGMANGAGQMPVEQAAPAAPSYSGSPVPPYSGGQAPAVAAPGQPQASASDKSSSTGSSAAKRLKNATVGGLNGAAMGAVGGIFGGGVSAITNAARRGVTGAAGGLLRGN